MTAAAAQVECAKAGPEAMAMPATPMVQSTDGAKASHDPCCDDNQKSPHDGKSCAQICAAMCATIAALPYLGNPAPGHPADAPDGRPGRPAAHARAAPRRTTTQTDRLILARV
jgi:hypothetical protein